MSKKCEKGVEKKVKIPEGRQLLTKLEDKNDISNKG